MVMATTITDREAGSLIMPTCIQWCISTYSNPYSKHYYYRNHRVGLNHHQPTNYISKKLPISYIKWFWPNIFSQCVEGGKSYSKDCAPARGACTFAIIVGAHLIATMLSQNYFPEPNRHGLVFLHPILVCMITC